MWFDASDRFSLSGVLHPFETSSGRIIDRGSVVCVDESRGASGSIRLRNLRACGLVPHGLTRRPVNIAIVVPPSHISDQPRETNTSNAAVPKATLQWFYSVVNNEPTTTLPWQRFDKGIEFVGTDDGPDSQAGYRIDWPFLKQDPAWEILSVSKQGGTVLAYRHGLPRLFLLDIKSSKWSALPVLHLPYEYRPETFIKYAQLSDDGESIAVCYWDTCILLRSPTATPLFNP